MSVLRFTKSGGTLCAVLHETEEQAVVAQVGDDWRAIGDKRTPNGVWAGPAGFFHVETLQSEVDLPRADGKETGSWIVLIHLPGHGEAVLSSMSFEPLWFVDEKTAMWAARALALSMVGGFQRVLQKPWDDPAAVVRSFSKQVRGT